MHAPEKLRKPFVDAVKRRDAEALYRLFLEFPGYEWGSFTRPLVEDLKTAKAQEDLTNWIAFVAIGVKPPENL